TEIDRSDRRVPLIYKGDADGREERLEYYCKWAQYREGLIDAFELINTTALPHIKTRYNAASLPGGLAGADQEYQQMALDAVRFVYEAVGDKVDIIYTGGANSGDQVLLGLENGGSAAGVNTAIRTFGIAAPRLFERRILQLIKQKYPDATSLGHIIGAATQRGPKVQHQSRI